MPPMSRFVSKRASGAKFNSASKSLTVMKSGKEDSTTKVVPGPVPPTDVTDSSTEKQKSTHRA